jgi:hypothetical protein
MMRGMVERWLCPEETVSLSLLKLVSMCHGAMPDEITPDSWILAPLCLFRWFVDDQGRFVPERDAVTVFKFHGIVG